MGHIGKTISAGWQHTGELAGTEQVLQAVVGVFKTEQNACQLPIRTGNDQMAAGLGLKTCGAHKLMFAFVQGLGRLGKRLGGDEQDRHRLRFSGAYEYRMHGYSAASRIDGFGA